MNSLLRIHYEHVLAWSARHVAVSFDANYAGSGHFDRYWDRWVIKVETRLAEFQYLIFLVSLSENCLHYLITRAGKYIQVWKFKEGLQGWRVHVYTTVMGLYHLQLP